MSKLSQPLDWKIYPEQVQQYKDCRVHQNYNHSDIIIVEYGVRIPDVAFEIQNRVKKAVESMTGLKVEEVNVHVQGVNTDTASDNEEKSEADD